MPTKSHDSCQGRTFQAAEKPAFFGWPVKSMPLSCGSRFKQTDLAHGRTVLLGGGRDDAVHPQVFHDLPVMIGDVPHGRDRYPKTLSVVSSQLSVLSFQFSVLSW